MNFYCPLCLTPLTEEDHLIRVCVEHQSERPAHFDCSDENIEEKIFCPRGGRCNGAVETGVFLSHVECEADNPFWDGKKVDIPGDDSTTDYQVTTPSGTQNVKVNHWQIRVLRRMPQSVRGMWFPLMLLRSMSQAATRHVGRRVGVLVELAGAPTVGKSVLAMQAMEYEGYVPAYDGKRHVEVTGYMFSRLPPGQAARTNPFLANLYYNYLMRMNMNGLSPLPPTRRMPGDLKVAFVAPSEAAEARQEVAGGGPAPPSPDGNSTGFITAVWQNMREIFKGTVEEIKRPTGHHPFWYTVAFYDAAGEVFVADGSIPEAIERVVDKVAVLVDASEIFGMTSGDSVAVANERIRKAKAQGLPCCLVVTKVDLVVGRLPPDEQEAVTRAAEELDAGGDETRKLIDRWLELQLSSNYSVGELRNRLRNIERVFFVWTEDLPTAAAQGTVQTSTKQPHSFGLAKFVCWCLGINWPDINQNR